MQQSNACRSRLLERIVSFLGDVPGMGQASDRRAEATQGLLRPMPEGNVDDDDGNGDGNDDVGDDDDDGDDDGDDDDDDADDDGD
jgi:hypothetical protein